VITAWNLMVKGVTGIVGLTFASICFALGAMMVVVPLLWVAYLLFDVLVGGGGPQCDPASMCQP